MINETKTNDLNNSNTELITDPMIESIDKIITVNNYPYGFRLKTTKTYQIEFCKNKGFRSIETTRDPKTGKMNKPKKSTYNDLMYLINKDGFITINRMNFTEEEKINEYELFIKENLHKLNLNDDMIDYLWHKLDILCYG